MRRVCKRISRGHACFLCALRMRFVCACAQDRVQSVLGVWNGRGDAGQRGPRCPPSQAHPQHASGGSLPSTPPAPPPPTASALPNAPAAHRRSRGRRCTPPPPRPLRPRPPRPQGRSCPTPRPPAGAAGGPRRRRRRPSACPKWSGASLGWGMGGGVGKAGRFFASWHAGARPPWHGRGGACVRGKGVREGQPQCSRLVGGRSPLSACSPSAALASASLGAAGGAPPPLGFEACRGGAGAQAAQAGQTVSRGRGTTGRGQVQRCTNKPTSGGGTRPGLPLPPAPNPPAPAPQRQQPRGPLSTAQRCGGRAPPPSPRPAPRLPPSAAAPAPAAAAARRPPFPLPRPPWPLPLPRRPRAAPPRRAASPGAQPAARRPCW